MTYYYMVKLRSPLPSRSNLIHQGLQYKTMKSMDKAARLAMMPDY